MRKINYVLPTWSGQRDSIPKIPYIKTHLEQLQSLKHNLSQITIGYPYNPKESKEYKSYMSSLNSVGNTSIYVEPMPNAGRSYGQFNRIFAKYQDQFQYWIFIEDDYIPAVDNFDDILINAFEQKKKEIGTGGFLCQCAKAWAGAQYHAAIANGIMDNESLKTVWAKNNGVLPHDIVGYNNGQVTFSRAFIRAKLFLRDLTPRFKAPYFHLRRGIEEHNPQGKEYIIVPIQMFNQVSKNIEALKQLEAQRIKEKKAKEIKLI